MGRGGRERKKEGRAYFYGEGGKRRKEGRRGERGGKGKERGGEEKGSPWCPNH